MGAGVSVDLNIRLVSHRLILLHEQDDALNRNRRVAGLNRDRQENHGPEIIGSKVGFTEV